MSLLMPVTLYLTSLLPWPLKGDDICKQQSTEMKHYRTQQSTGITSISSDALDLWFHIIES